jgi:hypothetical protein
MALEWVAGFVPAHAQGQAVGGEGGEGQLGQFHRLQVEHAGFVAPQHLCGQRGQRAGGEQRKQPFHGALGRDGARAAAPQVPQRAGAAARRQ